MTLMGSITCDAKKAPTAETVPSTLPRCFTSATPPSSAPAARSATFTFAATVHADGVRSAERREKGARLFTPPAPPPLLLVLPRDGTTTTP